MNKTTLCLEIKTLIEKVLELDKDSINFDTNLFDSNLELDSIGILELELNIKKKYDIQIERLPKEIFSSVEKIAEFIIDYHKQNA